MPEYWAAFCSGARTDAGSTGLRSGRGFVYRQDSVAARPGSASLKIADRILLLALSLVLLLPGTWVSLTDRDEGYYGQVCREMLAGGDWLVPQYLGQPWLFKPPLLYWAASGAFTIFGLQEWAARLVSVLALTGAVQFLAALAADMYNRRTALIACACFLTAGLPLIVGRMLLTDPLLLLWMMAAVWLLWRIATRSAGAALSAGFWLSLGLGVMTKGPTILLFMGAFGLALLLQPGRRKWIVSGRFWMMSPLVAIAAPWFIYIAQRHGDLFTQRFLFAEIILRMVEPSCGHVGPPGYYLLLSLAGLLPWTALVPGAVAETWGNRRADRAAPLLLVWCGLPWLILELMGTKLPHYVLPCYVPLAIMLGRMWDAGAGRELLPGQRAVLRLWTAVPIVIGLGMLTAAVFYHSAAWAWPVGAAGLVLVAGFWLVARAACRRPLAAYRRAVASMALFSIVAGAWLLPSLEPHRLSRVVAEKANGCNSGMPVIVSGYEEPSLFFYLAQPPQVLKGRDLADGLTDLKRPVVAILGASELTAAGLAESAAREGWTSVTGLNYSYGRTETIWVGRLDPRERSPGASRPTVSGG